MVARRVVDVIDVCSKKNRVMVIDRAGREKNAPVAIIGGSNLLTLLPILHFGRSFAHK